MDAAASKVSDQIAQSLHNMVGNLNPQNMIAAANAQSLLQAAMVAKNAGEPQ